MQTRFVQVSWGFQFTNAFLHISVIKAYMQSFERGIEVQSHIRGKVDLAFSSQDRMEEEILQHIRISDKLAKEELQDYLQEWVSYFEKCLKHPEIIEKIINEYNEKQLSDYEKVIDESEKKFRETYEYKTYDHLQFYQTDILRYNRFPGVSYSPTLVQYLKFFEAPDPDLIDESYLPQYMIFINPIISRCIKIAKKRLGYLKGGNELKQLPASTSKSKAIELPHVPPKRLKVSLSVEELAMLIRLLKDCNIITTKPDKAIHSFVAENFETVGRKGAKISSANMGRLFSSKNTDLLNFWIKKFNQLIKIAQSK
jgi:hypothetical protein